MSLERTELLFGAENMQRLKRAKVVVVGLGGVGGHAAESLARSGIGRLHLIDADIVERSNLNRQLFACKSAIGRDKVLAAKERLEEASDCIITVEKAFLTAENVERLIPPDTSFAIDAIDSLFSKVALIKCLKERQVPFISCLGAGNRLDPSAFTVTDLFKTEGCPLARKLRSELRKLDVCDVPVVFSREKPKRTGAIGSFAPVTAACGLLAAAYVCTQLSIWEEGL
ncbi:MAG: ThiF family adenylyltransferase [Clostridia bacterium]|nr:ThiF family adenylyltransferase [Clostridia bacterium]